MFDVKQVEGKSCPFLRCDVCGRPITDYRHGMAVFHEEWGVAFVHKHKKRKREGGAAVKSFPLDVLLLLVCRNTNIDMEKAEKKLKKLKGV